MSQDFDCRTQGCGQKVRYEPRPGPGGIGALARRTPLPAQARSVAVYLTCANGHVHRYDVPQPAGKPHGR